MTIGVDIGSSAVRAAEITRRGGTVELSRFGQVELPTGAVVDGEVVNETAVGDALNRLWTTAGFRSRRVVLGVSGLRVIVRQAEVPALNEEELRSALKFDAQELIPIPPEQTCFDFTVLDRAGATSDGKSVMRILLVAAHREMVEGHLRALARAGLDATAIEPTPLALMRMVPPLPPSVERPRLQAVVAIGAELTTVAVREGETPRFIRSLPIGGARLTAVVAAAAHIDIPVAEAMKREMGSDHSVRSRQVTEATGAAFLELAEEIRGTVDFFSAQADVSTIDRVYFTGGSSQSDQLTRQLATTLNLTVERLDPFHQMAIGDTGLSAEQLHEAAPYAVTAVGLALGETGGGRRLSVLPNEVAAARRARRVASGIGIGVAGMAVVLGVTGIGLVLQVHRAHAQVAATVGQVQRLEGQVNQLEAQTAVHSQVESRRQLAVGALAGDIDWVGLVQHLDATMPPGVSIGSFTGARTGATTSSSAATPSTGAPLSAAPTGSVSFTVTGGGGLPTVSGWLDTLAHDPALQSYGVGSIAISGTSTVAFTSTAGLTPAAESHRALELPK